MQDHSLNLAKYLCWNLSWTSNIWISLRGSTYKLSFGHRGLNHPCGKDNQIEITSQNHGFALDPNSLSKDIVTITHLNLNDFTVAGLEVNNKPIFSVQYHPEAGPVRMIRITYLENLFL